MTYIPTIYHIFYNQSKNTLSNNETIKKRYNFSNKPINISSKNSIPYPPYFLLINYMPIYTSLHALAAYI